MFFEFDNFLVVPFFLLDHGAQSLLNSPDSTRKKCHLMREALKYLVQLVVECSKRRHI
jgi:hypothetical protein